MKKIDIVTEVKSLLADIYTPVGIYLRIRDKYRDSLLLESTDNQSSNNAYSFICLNAIAGIEIQGSNKLEIKYPLQEAEKINIASKDTLSNIFNNFLKQFNCIGSSAEANFAQGLYGYTSYDSNAYLLQSASIKDNTTNIPLLRYRLYQYVIAINHYKDELFICENKIQGLPADTAMLEALIAGKDVPQYPFALKDAEQTNMTDEQYMQLVQKGIEHCKRGDVFQIVLSRRFQQKFTGDEFNVYRTLRNVNPSPYLFYFDYGDYKLLGSSPESQLTISNGKATLHPIAGTFKRSGNDAEDALIASNLLADAKENAEHVMLVDLARNDLSRHCKSVMVNKFKSVQYFSHVIHLASEVTGTLQDGNTAFDVMYATYPAGTLSGAPKKRAIELIEALEPSKRNYYGGAIGFYGFNGSCNHAIVIRTFLSKQNTLFYQAGAGVVAVSNPSNELQEVNNKLGALKLALQKAELIFNL